MTREEIETALTEPRCLLAVTRELTKSGSASWIVWMNDLAISEQESEIAALTVARAILSERNQ